MRRNDFQISEHFNLIEFQCPCCHTVMLHPMLVRKLEALRALRGRRLSISCAYRCAKFNSSVGADLRSPHRLGIAADIKVAPRECESFAKDAASCGFARILPRADKSYVHLEIR